jgi:hypothetical protein
MEVCEMNSIEWLHHPAINTAQIARQINMTPSLLNKKMRNRLVSAKGKKKWEFTIKEKNQLNQVKKLLFEELNFD